MDQHLTPHPSYRYSARIPAAEVTYRVGDVERAAACDSLADHFAAGRLDPAELDDRLARAMAARSQGDLRVLFTDLGPRRPAPATPTARIPEPAAHPAPGTSLPVLASLMVVMLLVAGGMLMALGLYDFSLFVAALLGGTATAVAGGCAVLVAQSAFRRR